MGKVLKDSQGNILLANGGAIEITSSIDPNIQAGNIKSGVNILGVTGTYTGSGGGSGSSGGGDGGTLVSITLPPTGYSGTVWYLDGNNNISSEAVGVPTQYGEAAIIQSWANSLLIVLYDLPFEPGDSYTLPNCTLITAINLKSRTTYSYCAIFQVNDV